MCHDSVSAAAEFTHKENPSWWDRHTYVSKPEEGPAPFDILNELLTYPTFPSVLDDRLARRLMRQHLFEALFLKIDA